MTPRGQLGLVRGWRRDGTAGPSAGPGRSRRPGLEAQSVCAARRPLPPDEDPAAAYSVLGPTPG